MASINMTCELASAPPRARGGDGTKWNIQFFRCRHWAGSEPEQQLQGVSKPKLWVARVPKKVEDIVVFGRV